MLSLYGEYVSYAAISLGLLHRGTEVLLESKAVVQGGYTYAVLYYNAFMAVCNACVPLDIAPAISCNETILLVCVCTSYLDPQLYLLLCPATTPRKPRVQQ